MYAWQRFDLGEMRDDLSNVKSLGLDVVRFFLPWETFQPAPDAIDPGAMRRLEALMDAIDAAGLVGMPALFCGHMSGVNWLPRWTLDEDTPHGRFRTITQGHTSPYGIGDFYAGEFLLRAQERLARAAGERLRGHPALWAWDLGNEFSNLREPNTPADAARWSERLTHALKETSGAMVTGGMHGEDLERDRGIRPSSIAAPWDFASMHGYSVYSVFSRGRLDTSVVPFLSLVQASCSGKRVLFTEMGNPTCPPGTVSPFDRVPLPGAPRLDPKALPRNAAPYACLSEEEMAAYGYAVIDKLHAQGALGAFWWCWADYAKTLADWAPFDRATHEMGFGIVRNDGTFKPIAHALARLARENRHVLPPQPPLVSEDAYYASMPHGVFDLYRSYCRAYD
jgi:endo-1,4-beta-mannosidase